MNNIIKTKTFWAGTGSVITGFGFIIIGNKAEGLQLIFNGLGLVFLRNALRKKLTPDA